MIDLIEELNKKKRQLDASISQLKINGSAFAEAEKKYKILLRQETLKLRDEGMAIGLIDKVIYGEPKIAEARFQRDVAKVVYEANQEFINVTKLEMKLIESRINREWGSQ